MKQAKVARIAELAAGQWGMVTSRQAAAADVDARTLARWAQLGKAERLAHGVYRLAGVPSSPYDDLRVVWISLDPGRTAHERFGSETLEVVSHRSAAVLLGLGNLDADVLEFSAPIRHQPRRADVVVHRVAVRTQDWQLVEGLPVTTPLRTIADLAAAHLDQGHLADVARDAIAEYGVPARSLAAVLRRYAHTYGEGSSEDLLNRLLRQAGVPRSAIELAARADPQRP